MVAKRIALMVDEMYQVLEVWYPYYRLVEAGLLRRRRLDHGGVMLVVTSAGRRGLRDLSVLRRLAPDGVGSPASEGRTTARATADDQPIDGASVAEDDPLLQLLNEWRLARAREEGVAPFRVAHVSLLGCIAAARPRTEAALLAIKGMSPGKLRRYGAELLRLVSEHARS